MSSDCEVFEASVLCITSQTMGPKPDCYLGFQGIGGIIAELLVITFENSWSLGVAPEDMKMVSMVPTLKKEYPGIYRPITDQSSFSS